MRHLIAATLVALVCLPALVARPASAQEYPVVEEFQGVNLMEYFINGASPIGNTDLERNCRPSDEEKEVLFYVRRDGNRGIKTYPFFFDNGERQGIVNRYFQCIGLGQFEEPEEFGCSSIKTLFRYLEPALFMNHRVGG